MYYVNIMRTLGKKGGIIIASVLAVVAIFSVTTTSAQTKVKLSEANYMTPSIGIVPGQTVRIGHFAFGDGSVRSVGGHVKVFDAAGLNVWQVPIREVAAGESDHIDISRGLLSHVGDPHTGRLQIRIEVLVIYESSGRQSSDSGGVFPPSFELINEETGESILIGTLLPAIQKVR